MRSTLIALGAFALSAVHVYAATPAREDPFDEEKRWEQGEGPPIHESKGPCARAEELGKALSMAALWGSDEALSYVPLHQHVNFTETVLGDVSEDNREKNVNGYDAAIDLLQEWAPRDESADPKLIDVFTYESEPTEDGDFEDMMIASLHEKAGGKRTYHLATVMRFDGDCKITKAEAIWGDVRNLPEGNWWEEPKKEFDADADAEWAEHINPK